MIASIATGLFAFSGFCAVIRLLRGPNLVDRIMALDVALISLMGGIAVQAVITGRTSNLVILIVVALIGFTATLAAARFLESLSEEGRT